MQRTKPPYRADHVGSLIRPDTLIKAREQAEQKAISEAELGASSRPRSATWSACRRNWG